MGALKENPRYNVVSVRITDEEREALQLIKRATRRSMSDIMREALCFLYPSATGQLQNVRRESVTP